MTNVKDAVRTATSFIQDLFPNALDIRLEEVESNGSNWSVVLSFQTNEPNTFASVMSGPARLFKTVQVDALGGEPTALKMWRA